jgi:enoyl-CoA hydratase
MMTQKREMADNARPESAADAGAQPAFSVLWIDEGAIFTIERPRKLNALTNAVLEGLASCLDALEKNNAKMLVITGRGERAFCAGTDLAELQWMTVEGRLDKSAMARSLFVRLARSRIISVAAINGLSLGGGLELAMACTVRISAPGAKFSLPEIHLGLLPAYAGTQFLPALVGPAKALDLMLTGRTVDADEALKIGLINRTTPADSSIVDAALAFAREITRHSVVAITAIRDCVDAAGSKVADYGLATEDKWVRLVFASPEAQAGVAAFLDRQRLKQASPAAADETATFNP